MEEKGNWDFKKLILGIRHDRTFYISDIQGNIIDRVISLQGEDPFPAECFAQITRPDYKAMILNDFEGIFSLNINIDGIIFEVDMTTEPPITVNIVEEMFSRLVNVVLPFTSAKEKIGRLGALFEYHLSKYENSAKAIYSKLLNLDIQGVPDNVNIKAAFKNISPEAIKDPKVKADFKNVILNISSIRETKEMDEERRGHEIGSPALIKLSIDYQDYYSPVRNLKDVNIKRHVSSAEDYINKLRGKILF